MPGGSDRRVPPRPPSASPADVQPQPRASTRDRGRREEDRVARFLRDHGLVIVDQNVDIAGAELDLIASSGEGAERTVVFVEVRSRTRTERGSPLETVDGRKRRQIVRAATAWLVREGLWERTAVRFDVVGVVGSPTDRGPDNDEAPEIQWIPGAFDADG